MPPPGFLVPIRHARTSVAPTRQSPRRAVQQAPYGCPERYTGCPFRPDTHGVYRGHQMRQRVLYGRRALAEPSPQHTRRDGGLPDEVHRRLHGQAAVSVLIQ